MRLLHVIASMNPKEGGVCQAVRSIIDGLSHLGVENEVVSLDSPGESFLSADNFLTNCLGPAKGPWSYSPTLIPWMIKNFDRFDSVIVHGLWLYPSYATNKALSIYKKQQHSKNRGQNNIPKIFVMPHGMLDPYFQRAAGRKMKAIRNWLYWKLIERKVVNDSNGVLFTCEEERNLAKEPFRPYHPANELVVGLGIDPPPVYTTECRDAFLAKCPELKGQPYLLFLARIHQKKGIDLLIKAYQQLQEKKIENVRLPKLVIAGPGWDTPYGKEIKQLCEQSKLPADIFLVGMLSGNEKWGALYGCEAFVLPSHQENFGIAVVEAMACKKPVLISDQVNIWREILNAQAGFVKKDSVEGTAELLQQWAHTSVSDKKLMAENARNCFDQNFSIQPVAKRLLTSLEENI